MRVLQFCSWHSALHILCSMSLVDAQGAHTAVDPLVSETWQAALPLLRRYFSNNCTPLTQGKLDDLRDLAVDDFVAIYPSATCHGRVEWLGHVDRTASRLGPCLEFSTVVPTEDFLVDPAVASHLARLPNGEWSMVVPWSVTVRPAACWAVCLCCLACREYVSTGVNTFHFRWVEATLKLAGVRTVTAALDARGYPLQADANVV